jgi:molybdopterin-guanine dinucleotide biosynthesis protein B
MMHELRDSPEPTLQEQLKLFSPCDLVIVEGYKNEPIPKIEVRRKGAHTPALHLDDAHVVAIATDDVLDSPLPQLDVNDAECVAHFIVLHLGLNRARLVR